MKQILFLISLLASILVFSSFTSKSTVKSNDHLNTVHDSVVQAPQYIGGNHAMSEFLKNALIYPKWESDHGIQGTVVVSFQVDTTGKVSSPSIVSTVQGAVNFDAEVKRVINLMPNWIPGEYNGKKVSMKVSLPIAFNLMK